MEYVITVGEGTLIALVLVTALLLGGLGWGAYRYAGRAVRRWRSALAGMPFGVLILDAVGRRTFANPTADTLLRQMDPSQLARARESAARGLQQLWIVRGAEGATVQAQALPLGGGADVLVTLRDITPQQRAEAGYRQLMRQLSHELMTPLTAIQGHLAYLDAEDDPERQRSVQVLRDEVERLTRLTSNLLLLSRLESEQPLQLRPTNLGAVAEEVVLALMERADARGITLNLHATPRLPRPAVDRDAWKQVFLNLVDNAVKYGREGGRVDVTLQEEDGVLGIAVADDGPGIAPDDLPHLFTEMFRAEAHRRVSGTGLGLTIVRRIVERHGGRITCASEAGRGTTFHISLPVDAAGGAPY